MVKKFVASVLPSDHPGWTAVYNVPKQEPPILAATTRHLYVRDGEVTLEEGGLHHKQVVEADNDFLRIGCTSISYDAFRKIADWWEAGRKANVRRMQ